MIHVRRKRFDLLPLLVLMVYLPICLGLVTPRPVVLQRAAPPLGGAPA